VTLPWYCRKPLARWVSPCERWHLPASAVEMGTRTATCPAMHPRVLDPLHPPCATVPKQLLSHGSLHPYFLGSPCPPSQGLCHQVPLCRQPSAGTGRWRQELCQPLSLACLLQWQFINIEELIRILQPTSFGGWRILVVCGILLQPCVKRIQPGLSQPGGLCPSLRSWLIHVVKAPRSLANGK